MVVGDFSLYTDKSITAAEFADLMASVGWGGADEYATVAVERSLAAYPFVVYAREQAGRLVGYVSAFSDGAFSTFIGELVVRPEAQHRGLGTELLRRVEERYPGIPVYVQCFEDVDGFFRRRGYRAGRRTQDVLFKIPVSTAPVAGFGLP